MTMDSTALIIIMSLMGFLQTIFMFLLAYIFKMIGTIFNKLDAHKKDNKADKDALEDKFIKLLDSHYVTTGQHTTLEQKLIGKMNGLTISINNLNNTIREKL